MPHNPVKFDPQQVTAFLDKINRDRDRELQDIADQQRARIAQLRRDAFVESRRIFRKAVQQVRNRQRQEHDRYLANVRAKL